MKTLSTIVIFGCMPAVAHAQNTPSEVATLQIHRERKIQEINRVYLRELESLKLIYTKKGDLEAANLCVNLIKDLNKDSPPTVDAVDINIKLPKNDEELKKFISGSVWVFDDGKELLFGEDGIVKKSWGQNRPFWVVKDMEVIYEGKNMRFNKDFTKIEDISKSQFPRPGKRLKP